MLSCQIYSPQIINIWLYVLKLFQTNNIYITEDCRFHFGITLPSKFIETRSQRFVNKYNSVFHSFCKLFVRQVTAQPQLLSSIVDVFYLIYFICKFIFCLFILFVLYHYNYGEIKLTINRRFKISKQSQFHFIYEVFPMNSEF